MSDSLANLFDEFNLRIELSGGRLKLANDIQKEWDKSNADYWTMHEIWLLVNNVNDVDRLMSLTGKSAFAIENKVKILNNMTKNKKVILKI